MNLPSEQVLKQKQQIVAELADQMKNSVAGVLVDYKGINVADDTKLRKEMREAGIKYSVIKNTLLLRAAQEIGFNDLEKVLAGTTALAMSDDDPVAAAKILCKYADGSKGKFSIKAGFVEGKLLEVDEVKNLSKLPSKEVLVAKMLGSMNAPISGFVNVLNGNIRGLAVVLGRIAEQKGA